jgi:hypothetical protein
MPAPQGGAGMLASEFLEYRRWLRKSFLLK